MSNKDAIFTMDIPLFDVQDQRILEKQIYRIELYKDFLKYQLEFDSDETDEEELIKQMERYSDDTLRDLIEKPTKQVHRAEINYTDRLSIVSITYNLTSDNGFGMILVSSSDNDESKFFFKSRKKAMELMETLTKWRWG